MAMDAEQIARVASGRLVYVIDGETLPDALLLGDGGCFFPGLDLAFRPQLKASGRWEGPGIAVMVNTPAIRAAYAEAGHEGAEESIVGIALHETAHALDSSGLVPSKPFEAFTAACAGTAATRQDDAPRYSRGLLASHGARFTRIACHLWARAFAAGCRISIDRLGIGSSYPAPGFDTLPSPVECFTALLDETQRLRSRTIEEVLATAPTAAFSALWGAHR